MPWSEQDYPASMNKLDKLVRRKAIDIANAMVKEGYQEDAAIPIAISSAKEWVNDASKSDKQELQDKDITDHHDDPDDTSSRLQDNDVEVSYSTSDKVWVVKTKGAQKADSKHDTKEQATQRAQEIADNKNVKVVTHQKNE